MEKFFVGFGIGRTAVRLIGLSSIRFLATLSCQRTEKSWRFLLEIKLHFTVHRRMNTLNIFTYLHRSLLQQNNAIQSNTKTCAASSKKLFGVYKQKITQKNENVTYRESRICEKKITCWAYFLGPPDVPPPFVGASAISPPCPSSLGSVYKKYDSGIQ